MRVDENLKVETLASDSGMQDGIKAFRLGLAKPEFMPVPIEYSAGGNRMEVVEGAGRNYESGFRYGWVVARAEAARVARMQAESSGPEQAIVPAKTVVLRFPEEIMDKSLRQMNGYDLEKLVEVLTKFILDDATLAKIQSSFNG